MRSRSAELGLNKMDVLGFSIGGMVAQEIALQTPDLVRKLILVGTGPRGGQGMESLTQVAQRIFGAAYDRMIPVAGRPTCPWLQSGRAKPCRSPRDRVPPDEGPEHLWLTVLFSPSEAGQAAGLEFLKRKALRAAWGAPAHSRSLPPVPRFSSTTAAARRKPALSSQRYAMAVAERMP
jgi:pimeloyl-ACP methyl ester carboxylesterase